MHPTRDGYLTVLIGPDHRSWRNACVAMGHPELADDPRFDDEANLSANNAEATAIMRAWLLTMTSREAERQLSARHVACGVVMTIDEAARQPQVIERGLIATVEDPLLGETELVNSAFRYSNAQSGVAGPAPMLGAHNIEILREELGYDADEIRALEESDVLRSANI